MNKILKLPLDKSKRHFILGDCHGRYDTFLNLLKDVNYDEENDIIYSVGDLIDRGPKSYEVVKFFTTQPNTYSIMGNHEYMMLNSRWRHTWLFNGGHQCLDSIEDNDKDYQWLIDQLKDIPWIIEVGEDNEEQAFRIVHADVNPKISDNEIHQFFDIAVDEDGEFDGESSIINQFIWSRETITKALRNDSNLKPLTYEMNFHHNRKRHNYVGHTPIQKIITVGDITFLDTWGSHTLSMIEAISGDRFTTPVID